MQEARLSVAHIQTITRQSAGHPFLQMTPDAVRPGSGSGFIWDSHHVVTNFHVVEKAHEVKATLSNQQTYPATVIGSDPNNDVAVLRLQTTPQDVKPISIGTSHDLMVGQRVFAIGAAQSMHRLGMPIIERGHIWVWAFVCGSLVVCVTMPTACQLFFVIGQSISTLVMQATHLDWTKP